MRALGNRDTRQMGERGRERGGGGGRTQKFGEGEKEEKERVEGKRIRRFAKRNLVSVKPSYLVSEFRTIRF